MEKDQYSHKSEKAKGVETRPSIYNIVYLGPMKEKRYLVGPRGANVDIGSL